MKGCLGLGLNPQNRSRAARWALIAATLAIALCSVALPQPRELFRGFLLGYRSDLAWVPEQSASRMPVSESPRLTADFYAVQSPERPLVIFAHGSTASGRRHGATRLLSRRLQQAGFPVLAVDLPGFGESEAPQPLNASFSFVDALVTSADYAIVRKLVGPGGFVYAGSSLGAMVALGAGRQTPRARGIVALGGADTETRYRQGGEIWKRRFAAERLSAMEVGSDDATLEVLGDHLVELDVVRQLEDASLPPVLLIYGERDPSLAAVRSFLAHRQQPHELHVLPDTPHSLYMKPLWKGLVLHNRETIDSILAAIRDWTEEVGPRG